jgi:hypothetical protein
MTALAALARAERIRTIALRSFESAPARSRVRRTEVYAAVMAELGGPGGAGRAREVIAAVKPLGWRAVAVRNARFFAGVKRR